jgi:hypothetical protein
LPSAFWQTDVCLNFFGSFGECVCIHCFDFSFVSTLTNETQFHYLLVIHCDWEIERHICGIGLKISKTSLYVLCARLTIFGYAGITDFMTLTLLTLSRRQRHSDIICSNGSLKATAAQFDTTV